MNNPKNKRPGPPVVLLSESMGLCGGVRRALDLAEAASNQAGATAVFALGDLVHSRHVMDWLAGRGVKRVQSPGEVTSGTVIIRAHGERPDALRDLEERGVRVIDATCSKVARSHRIVEEYRSRGYHIIVAGERGHSEVAGIVARAGSCTVVETASEAGSVDEPGPCMLIAQTTFRREEFDAIRDVLKARIPGLEVVESICPAMAQRQAALSDLAKRVDAIVVIGGKHSANTVRLYETARSLEIPCWHIEGPEDLPAESKQYLRIGVTAGASTPDWIVDSVVARLRGLE